MSTESHIPDFRSDNGLYKRKYPYPAETMLSHTFYTQHPKEFFEFYFNEMIYQDAVPNKAHAALAKLEQEGKLKSRHYAKTSTACIKKAGSLNVLELHGSVLRNFCTRCHKAFTLEETIARRDQDGIPRCDVDNAIIKPGRRAVRRRARVNRSFTRRWTPSTHVDTLIVGGTSLVVYPAAGLIQYFRGKKPCPHQPGQHANGWKGDTGHSRRHRQSARRSCQWINRKDQRRSRNALLFSFS